MTASRCRGLFRLAVVMLLGAVLGACHAAERLANVGQEPQFRPIENPIQRPDYTPVAMPMPPGQPVVHQPNSLWRTGARAFFKDQRAARVGDILTILIDIRDRAELANTTRRTRDNVDRSAWTRLFGYEAALSRVLPEAIDPSQVLDLGSELRNTGTGIIDREETVNLKLAAIVTQVLPNGNLVIEGNQEVRVNYELRELRIHGIVRREDIEANNTVSYEKIAEARIAYGGRGHITDVQQPRYGSQILDIINPF